MMNDIVDRKRLKSPVVVASDEQVCRIERNDDETFSVFEAAMPDDRPIACDQVSVFGV